MSTTTASKTSFVVRETRSKQNKVNEKLTNKRAISSQESATSSPDLTPPSSDSLQSQEDCHSKKSLFTSPKACAVKSLKRLSSECKSYCLLLLNYFIHFFNIIMLVIYLF